MGGEESLRKYSPEITVQDPNNKQAVSILPPVILFHGTADYSIPADCRYESRLFTKFIFFFQNNLKTVNVVLFIVKHLWRLSKE